MVKRKELFPGKAQFGLAPKEWRKYKIYQQIIKNNMILSKNTFEQKEAAVD